MNNNQSLAKIAKRLCLNEPFYGLLLLTLNKNWNSDISTACVSRNNINLELNINPDYWEKCDDITKYNLLKHELLHIAFFHIDLHYKYSDPGLRNIAADLEVNQYITDPPKNWVLLEQYNHLNPKPKAGLDYYYGLLDANKNNPQTKDQLERFGYGKSMHELWKEFKDLPENVKDLIKSNINSKLKSVAEQINKSRGTIPGELKSYIDSLYENEPPKFNWKKYLRRFVGNTLRTSVKKSRMKLNKRFVGQPGLKVKKKTHICVAIDTSGSVSNDELAEFFNEINHMHKTGVEITIVQADTKINSIKKYSGKKEEYEIHGRGGTTFNPVIEYYNENRRNYTCLIYLTDGEAPAPPKAQGSMLWVMSSKSRINPDLIGPQIKLN